MRPGPERRERGRGLATAGPTGETRAGLLRALGGQAARDLGRGEELDRARGKRGEGGLLVSSLFLFFYFKSHLKLI